MEAKELTDPDAAVNETPAASSRPDITRYCDRKHEGYRYATSDPFVRAGFTYATDGRVCVRVPAPGEPDTLAGDRTFPGGAGLGLPWPAETPSLLPWPAPNYEWAEQPQGEFDVDAKPSWVWIPSPLRQAVGNREIRSTYHYLVSLLPNVGYSPHGGEHDPIYFAFDGGEGLLMPLAKERA